MSEIENIRNAKLAEYQEQMKLQEQLTQLEMTAKSYMEPAAFERYSTLKTAHQDYAIQLLVMINQAISSGKITSRISDAQFKEILGRLAPKQQSFRITRK